MAPHRKSLLPAARFAVLLLLAASCKSDEAWTFALTRELWTEGFDQEDLERVYRDQDPDDPMAGLALCLLVCPVVVDVVLLPVTITHDLAYLD